MVEVDGEILVVMSYPVEEALPMPSCLSMSEKAVVQLACDGLSSREIASRRRVSHRTVCNQLESAYRKLGVRSRDAMIALLSTRRD